MAKQQSEAPIRLPTATQVKALLKEGARVKERVGEIAGTYGDRVKSAIENGNLHGAAFGKAKSIFNKGRTNELAALEQIHHLRVYLDWIEEDISNKGHVGNLDDQAKSAAAGEAKAEEAPAPAAETAPGGVPLDDAQKMFEGTKAIAANRKAASKALEIPALDPDAPPAPPAAEAAPAEKPKRGRPAKGAAAAKADAAPPPPPAAVGGLPDDDEEDLRPAFLKAKDDERKAAAVH